MTPHEKPTKVYLGDGVYADLVDNMIKLTTENGIEATNTIYLEPEVVQNLLGFIYSNNEDVRWQ